MKRSLTIILAVALAAGTANAEPVTSPTDILKAWGVDRSAGGPVVEGGEAGAHVDLQVQFAYDSAELTPQAVEQLEALAAALRDAAVQTNAFRVEGHTDSTGSEAYNQALSKRRAQAVASFLVGAGIAANRVRPRGYGESRPIAPNTDAEGQALNRRVAVVNLGKGTATAAAAPPPDEPEKKTARPAAAARDDRPPAPPADDADRPSVDVVVRYERNGEAARLEAGQVLNVVDNYQVGFTPSRKSYVYVLQFDSKGEVATIFPNASHSEATNPVEAATSYTIPSTGGWLKLRETPGEEEIIVLSSSSAILDPRRVASAVRSGEVDARGLPDLADQKPAEVPADLFTYRLPYKKKSLPK